MRWPRERYPPCARGTCPLKKKQKKKRAHQRKVECTVTVGLPALSQLPGSVVVFAFFLSLAGLRCGKNDLLYALTYPARPLPPPPSHGNRTLGEIANGKKKRVRGQKLTARGLRWRRRRPPGAALRQRLAWLVWWMLRVQWGVAAGLFEVMPWKVAVEVKNGAN